MSRKNRQGGEAWVAPPILGRGRLTLLLGGGELVPTCSFSGLYKKPLELSSGNLGTFQIHSLVTCAQFLGSSLRRGVSKASFWGYFSLNFDFSYICR